MNSEAHPRPSFATAPTPRASKTVGLRCTGRRPRDGCGCAKPRPRACPRGLARRIGQPDMRNHAAAEECGRPSHGAVDGLLSLRRRDDRAVFCCVTAQCDALLYLPQWDLTQRLRPLSRDVELKLRHDPGGHRMNAGRSGTSADDGNLGRKQPARESLGHLAPAGVAGAKKSTPPLIGAPPSSSSLRQRCSRSSAVRQRRASRQAHRARPHPRGCAHRPRAASRASD